MFPVEAQTRVVACASIALAVASAMPRSLKDPLGLKPSALKKRLRKPSAGPMRVEARSGVEPSPRVTSGVVALTGRRSR